MRSFFTILIVLLLLGGSTYFILNMDEELSGQAEVITSIGVLGDISALQSDDVFVSDKSNETNIISVGLFSYINQGSNELIKAFGQPLRKDLSAYGYTWWVYTNHKSEYIQFGVENDIVKTIYATGDTVASSPFSIGTNYETINAEFPILNEVVYKNDDYNYTFVLNKEQQKMTPLIKLAENLFIQCYFDVFTNKLSSVRIATGDLLLEQRFYEMEYRGELPEIRVFDDETWALIEKGMERQILDISNIFRNRHGLSPLVQEPHVREVAYLHSKDMSENSYFSHNRLDGTGLKERLAENGIVYSAAGENIAAHYSDAPAAVEGWLNSEGHREALLYAGYSHLGTGVYQLYYTQNFIKNN